MNKLVFSCRPVFRPLPCRHAQHKVDIFGYYTPVTATGDFKNIAQIHLAGDYGEQQTPKVYGLIRMRDKERRIMTF